MVKGNKFIMTPSLVSVIPSYNDGFSGAPGIAAQYSTLLSGYAARPSWKVAGVDTGYGVGCNNTGLTDWQSLSFAGLTLNTNQVRIDNLTGHVFQNVDFSLHGGASLDIINSSSTSVLNCKLSSATYATMFTGPIYADGTSPGLIVKYCTIDGNATGGADNQSGLILATGGGVVTVQYNWLKNFPQQIVDLSLGTTLDYRFNLIDNGLIATNAHMNYLQWNSGASSAIFGFNTTLQTLLPATSPGEGPQAYYATSGSFSSFEIGNNTMIAKKNAGSNTVANLLHGSDVNTTLSGSCTIHDNYIDGSGTGNIFYPNSFVARGWVASGNIDMTTGGVIVPT